MQYTFVRAIALAACGLLLMPLIVLNAPALDAQRTSPSVNLKQVTLKERGENYRRWQTVKTVTNHIGANVRVFNLTNSYTELGAGICYVKPDGTWADSKAEIVLSPDGGAEATELPHKVHFSPDIHSVGAVRLTLPDGRTMGSTIRGLFFYEPDTQRSVLLSEITNSIGVLHPPNRIVYSNCFSHVRADLVLTVTTSGLEQDVVLRERLPVSPEMVGLDPAKTVLESWTEFFDAPPPEKRSRLIQRVASDPTSALPDETLQFGAMSMRDGRAFSLEAHADIRSRLRNSLRVLKTWERLQDDRDFLIEAVRWDEVRPHLEKLSPNSASLSPANRSIIRSADVRRVAPARLLATASTDASIRMARVTTPTTGSVATALASADNAFVLDYVMVYGTHPTFTFLANETYHITTPVFITSEARFQAGAILKFDEWTSIEIDGAIVCDTGPARPAILTGRDDDSLGEIVAGSTGTPSQGAYAVPAIKVNGPAADLKYLRISYAGRAVDFNNPGAQNVLSHSQITHSSSSIHNFQNTLAVRNVLIYNVDQAFEGESFTVNAEHVTARLAFDLAVPWFGSGTLNMLNSLVVGIPSCSATHTLDHSQWLVNDNPIFQTAGSGDFYLPAGSPYKGAGSPNISSTLKADLKSKTTYAPLPLTTISTPAVLAPYVPRNSGPNPDLGYSYDVIDYLAANASVDATSLLLTNGVVIATEGGAGLTLQNGAKVVSEGSPLSLNKVVHTRFIQERSAGAFHFAFSEDYDVCPPSHLIARFTDFWLADSDYIFNGGLCVATIALSDCQIRGGALSVGFQGPNSCRLALTNNLFEGVQTTITDGDATVDVQVRNNLFKDGSLTFSYGDLTWRAHDNLFDSVALTANGNPIENSHNGYYQATQLSGSSPQTDVLLSSPVPYQTGPLGRYYLPGGTFGLLSRGSLTPAAAGLFHYTTQVSQTREGSKASGVKADIGLHYVSLSSRFGEIVWVEDAIPPGSVPVAEPDPWTWISSSPPPYEGSLAHQSPVRSGTHQHYFYNASPLEINPGDKLFCYIYLDSGSMPSEVMLQWLANDSTGWSHRAYWGANNITWSPRTSMGALPAAGAWVRLEVPANAVNLEGRSIVGMAFTLYGGRATWDRAGLLPQSPALHRYATQSSPGTGPAHLAVDGNTSGRLGNGSVARTDNENQPWWQLDLGLVESIQSVTLWNRTDCCGDSLSNFYLLVSDAPFESTVLNTTLSQDGVSSYYIGPPVGTSITIPVNRMGRYLRVQLAGANSLQLAEVQVNTFSTPRDQEQDGIPDYFEDRNGDGIVNSGETDYKGPIVKITGPADGFAVNTTRINVQGNVTHTTPIKDVAVNGVRAFLTGTAFEGRNVSLDAGANLVLVTATDLAGNSGSAMINIAGVPTGASLVDPVVLVATPGTGFAPLNVSFQVTSAAPGAFQDLRYDFQGNNAYGAPITTPPPFAPAQNSYAAGEYFPVATVRTSQGSFSSAGGWNSAGEGSVVTARLAPQTTEILITDPVDVKAAPAGGFYVLSRSGASLIQYDGGGNVVRSVSGIGSTPNGFDVDVAGRVYVAVSGANQVKKYAPNGASFQLDTTFNGTGRIGKADGTVGTAPGEFSSPYDVAITSDGQTIFVSDSGNHRIQKFTRQGTHLLSIGSQGSGFGQLAGPKGLSFSTDGVLFVVDSGNSRIVQVIADSVFNIFGGIGTGAGQYHAPLNISSDAGSIYIADTGNNRVQSLDRGTFVPVLQFASELGFSQPSGIAIADGSVDQRVYVADTGNNRVLTVQAREIEPTAVWNSANSSLIAGDTETALREFSVTTTDFYRAFFALLGSTKISADMNAVPALVPLSIDHEEARYYFVRTYNGQPFTFVVTFVKENGIWKIRNF